MTKSEMYRILAEHLAKYREWSYAHLAERIDRGSILKPHDCLENIEGTASDGTEYQIELNVFWNDKPDGEIRVIGDLSTRPQRRLFGFVPIYTPDVMDCFVMAPDGRFLFENEK